MQLSKTASIFLLLTISINIVEALEATTNTDINVIRNTPKEIPITIKNTENFIIYNITFTTIDGFSFPIFNEIQPNESITKNIIINTQQAFTETKSTTISFFYKTNTTSTSITKDVSVEETILNPNNVTLKLFDRIRWNNLNPTKDFTIKKTDNSESITVPKNNNAERVFNELGEWSYFVQETGFIGKVTTLTNTITILTHDQAKDKTISFNIKSTNTPSTLQAENLIASFSMDYNQREQGAIKLTSDSEVFNIILSSTPGWLAFHQTNVNFNRTKIITFDIVPKITHTNETNQTYNLNISISAENAPNLSLTLPIFIKYAEFIVENSSEFDKTVVFLTEEQLQAFCNKRPDICSKYVEPIVQEVFIEKNDTVVNQLSDMNDRLDRLKNAITGRDDDVTGVKSGFNDLNTKMDGAITEVQAIKEQLNQQKRNRTLLWVFGILGIVVIVGIGVAYGGKKWVDFWLRSKNQVLR